MTQLTDQKLAEIKIKAEFFGAYEKPFVRALIAEIDRQRKEIEALQKDKARLDEGVQCWKHFYESALIEAENEIVSQKVAGDNYGMNFHQGVHSGLIKADIGLVQLKQALTAESEGEK